MYLCFEFSVILLRPGSLDRVTFGLFGNVVVKRNDVRVGCVFRNRTRAFGVELSGLIDYRQF